MKCNKNDARSKNLIILWKNLKNRIIWNDEYIFVDVSYNYSIDF